MSKGLLIISGIIFAIGAIVIIVAFNMVKKGQRLYKGDYQIPEYRALRNKAFKTMVGGIFICIAAWVVYTVLC